MYQRSMRGAVNVIGCSEPLLENNAPELEELAQSMLGVGQPLWVFDMSSLPLMDSCGLETLLSIKDQFEMRGGYLKLASPLPLCRDILHVTGLEEEFEIFDRVVDAVGSFIR